MLLSIRLVKYYFKVERIIYFIFGLLIKYKLASAYLNLVVVGRSGLRQMSIVVATP